MRGGAGRWRWENTVSPRGFSLLELTVVLVVTAIVAGMGIVRYSGAQATYRVDLAARRMTADLEKTRREARATGEPYFFELDAGRSAYRHGPESTRSLTAAQLAAQPVKPTVVAMKESPYGVSVSGVTWTNTGNHLFFDGFGAASQGLRVELTAGQNRTRRVYVDKDTGNVRME